MELIGNERKIRSLRSQLGSVHCHDHSWFAVVPEPFLYHPNFLCQKRRSEERVDTRSAMELAGSALHNPSLLATHPRMGPRTLRRDRRILEETKPETGQTALSALRAREESR